MTFSIVVTEKGRRALAEIADKTRGSFQITEKGKQALRLPTTIGKPKRSPNPEPLDAAGILRGESSAIQRLFTRYAPLLHHIAIDLRVSPYDANHIVTTLFDDVVLAIIERRRFPRDIGNYLVAALKNRVTNCRRDTRRYETRDLNASHDYYGERVVPSAHSEYGQRGADPDFVDASASDAVIDFVNRVVGSLGERDRTLLEAVSAGSDTYPTIAARVGISSGSMRVRIHRTREQLRRTTGQFLAELQLDQRLHVERMLKRAGIN